MTDLFITTLQTYQNYKVANFYLLVLMGVIQILFLGSVLMEEIKSCLICWYGFVGQVLLVHYSLQCSSKVLISIHYKLDNLISVAFRYFLYATFFYDSMNILFHMLNPCNWIVCCTLNGPLKEGLFYSFVCVYANEKRF